MRGRLRHYGLLLPRRRPPARVGALALLLDAAVGEVGEELEGRLALLVRVRQRPRRRARQLVVQEPDVEGVELQALLL